VLINEIELLAGSGIHNINARTICVTRITVGYAVASAYGVVIGSADTCSGVARWDTFFFFTRRRQKNERPEEEQY